jgi:hypothetical protein
MTAPSSVSREYFGRRAWAEAWAKHLQSTVGTVARGQRTTRIVAQGYGETFRFPRWAIIWWSVVEYWEYERDPSLGEFGEENALYLPKEMPP